MVKLLVEIISDISDILTGPVELGMYTPGCHPTADITHRVDSAFLACMGQCFVAFLAVIFVKRLTAVEFLR